MGKSLIALALLACVASRALCAPGLLKENDEPTKKNYRLPTTATPKSYDIELTLEKKDGVLSNTFKGIVDILIETKNDEAQTISLHRGGKITITKMSYCENQDISIDPLDYDPDTEIMKIPILECTDAAKKHLIIEYDGELYDDEMYGFYVSTFTAPDAERKPTQYKFATTQFQGTFARRAFPCFDEPSFKAKFTIRITHPEDFTAISNQKVETCPSSNGNAGVDAGDPKTTCFAVTPTMPTYLIAFIVYPAVSIECGDVKSLTGSAANDLPMKVCAPKHLKTTMKFAQDETRAIIDHLNKITQISYHTKTACAPQATDRTNMCDGDVQMEQLNQVAVPDFAAGAMENWGLVTYRETALLFDDNESTLRDKQRIATVIAHEFAHMWFGDMVTLAWWKWTWLNEGFARYFEYHVINDLKEDWEMADQFVIEQMHSIFQQDVQGAQSLTSEVNTDKEAKAKFGSITYNKGACVLRMLERALQEETCAKVGAEESTDCFLNGLNAYLKTNAFKNTEPKQLYEAFGPILESTGSLLKGDTLENFMNSWTNHHGYPLVTASLKDKKITFKQEPFKYTAADTADAADTYKWLIPITYYKQGETQSTKPKKLMEDEWKTDVVLDDDKFLIVNVGQTGYYRVNYDDALWGRITKALMTENFGDISAINRAQITDDTFNLARIGEVNYANAFDNLKFLTNEVSYYPWYAAFNGFSYLRRRLPESAVKDKITELLKKRMDKVYKEVKDFNTLDLSKQIETYKKILVLQWACEINLSTCREDALKMFKTNEGKVEEEEESKKQNVAKKTPADLRKIVYCEAARESDDNWRTLWKEYEQTTSAANKVTIINALGCSTKQETLKSYLAKSINATSGIRKQDAYSVFTAVLTGNPEGVAICVEFLKEHYPEIRTAYGSMNALSTVITSVADRITSATDSATFLKFLEDHETELDDAKEVIPVAQSTIASNTLWVQKYEKELKKTFGIEDKDDGDNAAPERFAFSLTALVCVALALIAAF